MRGRLKNQFGFSDGLFPTGRQSRLYSDGFGISFQAETAPTLCLPAGIGICVRGRSAEVNCRLIAFCFFRTIKRYDNAVFVSYICFVFNGNIALGIECDKWEGGKFARFHAACVSDADNIAFGIFSVV